MSTFIQTTLLTTRLKTLSKRLHASSRLVTSLGVFVLVSGTQVGHSTSATLDTMIEVRSSSGSRTGSKEKRRKYVNLSIRAERFPSTIWESVYRKGGIERSRRDWV